MKCIIIDDEPLALNIIKSYCEDLGTLQVAGIYTNALDALPLLNSEKIDLIFCDIEMPQINGIEFIKALTQQPMFIFTTAYPEYALEGFELNAVDYLVKPVPFPRFIKAVSRARELYQLKSDTQVNTINLTPTQGVEGQNDPVIFVKADYNNVRIKLEDIRFVQGLKDYLKIHTQENKPILTLMNFKEILAKLPAQNFLRVHRSFIVNIHHIESIQRNKIVIRDIRIPIGDSYKSEFFKRIGI
ncbi:LytR/AlgR family response regulator transcription factor [Flavobacteriaceae bacterium M23B6Z8]